ncbi:hypothetical protein LV779_00205 [Streptomyces thinghirensis]|nr:hypothetical protein [Streptomyces thinghirensis]
MGEKPESGGGTPQRRAAHRPQPGPDRPHSTNTGRAPTSTQPRQTRHPVNTGPRTHLHPAPAHPHPATPDHAPTSAPHRAHPHPANTGPRTRPSPPPSPGSHSAPPNPW